MWIIILDLWEAKEKRVSGRSRMEFRVLPDSPSEVYNLYIIEEKLEDTCKELEIRVLTLILILVFKILFYRKIGGLKKLSIP